MSNYNNTLFIVTDIEIVLLLLCFVYSALNRKIMHSEIPRKSGCKNKLDLLNYITLSTVQF